MVAYARSHLDALRLPAGSTKTGYRNVYLLDDGKNRSEPYAAVVKVGGKARRLGTARTAWEAALRVAAWYEERYGPLWELVVRRRKCNPWEVRPDPTTGGFIVHVWEWGKCVTLGGHLHPTDPARDSPSRRPWVFPTRAAAKWALVGWRTAGVKARWGDKAREALTR